MAIAGTYCLFAHYTAVDGVVVLWLMAFLGALLADVAGQQSSNA